MEVLRAIYSEDLEGPNYLGWYRIKVVPQMARGNGYKIGDVYFSFIFHEGYPNDVMPGMKLEGDGLLEEEVLRILEQIRDNIFVPNEQCLFGAISWLISEFVSMLNLVEIDDTSEEEEEESEEDIPIEIIHGESITDRKSG